MYIRNSFASLFLLLCCSPIAFSQAVSCKLLTQDQVSSAVAASVGAGSALPNGCSWSSTGKGKLMVTVSTQSEKLYAGAKSGSKTPVSGIGDEAFFTGVQNFVSLWVKKGGTFLLLRLYGLPVNEAQPKLTALAKMVVPKL